MEMLPDGMQFAYLPSYFSLPITRLFAGNDKVNSLDRCLMRCSLIPLNLALAVVLALPVVGHGVARACYLPTEVTSQKTTTALLGQNTFATALGESSDDGLIGTEVLSGSNEDGKGDPTVADQLHFFQELLGLLQADAGGTGLSGTGSGATGQGVGAHAGLLVNLEVPRPDSVSPLFLADSFQRPPPFLSGLFRPPRFVS
jgi:hypothetical protein